MKFGKIKGPVTAKGHEEWIELESVQMAIHGSQGGKVPSTSEVAATKNQDSSSTDLYRAALSGEGVTVLIDFVKSGDPPEVYLSVELTNTLISSYNLSGSGGGHDRPMESFSLNYSQIKYGHHTATAPLTGTPPMHHLY